MALISAQKFSIKRRWKIRKLMSNGIRLTTDIAICGPQAVNPAPPMSALMATVMAQ